MKSRQHVEICFSIYNGKRLSAVIVWHFWRSLHLRSSSIGGVRKLAPIAVVCADILTAVGSLFEHWFCLKPSCKWSTTNMW